MTSTSLLSLSFNSRLRWKIPDLFGLYSVHNSNKNVYLFSFLYTDLEVQWKLLYLFYFLYHFIHNLSKKISLSFYFLFNSFITPIKNSSLFASFIIFFLSPIKTFFSFYFLVYFIHNADENILLFLVSSLLHCQLQGKSP